MTLLITFALLFMTTCFVVAVVTYILYWYEHQSRIENLFPSRNAALHAARRGVFSAFFAEIFSFSIYLGGTFLQYWRKRVPKLPAEPESPIIMVHGLFHNSSAWVLFRHWFRKLGLGNCATFYYSSRKPFDVVSAELDKYLEAVLKQAPNSKPVLIGHSLGGLLLRNWLATSEQADKVAGVITLGTPMLGSKLATFSATYLGQQLDFKGKLISEIEGREAAQDLPVVPCYAFYSPVDNMVLPQESVSTPPKGWNVVKTKPVSHLAMLSSKTIAKQVAMTVKELFSK